MTFLRGLQNLHPRFKSGRRLQFSGSNSIVCAFSGTSDAFELDYSGHKSRSPGRGSRRKPLINNELIFVGLGKGEGSEDLCPRVQSQQRFAGRRRQSMTAAQRKAVGLPMKKYRGSDRSTERCASPRLAPRASFSSRNRSYLLTAILTCRSVGRTIGNGGLVTTSLTQRASPPLK